MKTTIKAEIVAHSINNEQGDELISVLATFPRIILAEVNTHRMLSKNTSSSRAIPFNKMVETIKEDPFIPIAWQKEHKGMQGTEYFTETEDIKSAEGEWLKARNLAVQQATWLSGSIGITKQLANRLLEPFMWTTMLITGPKSGWENFFNLRCPSYRVGGKGDVASSTNTYRSKKDAIKDYPGSADEPEINWMLWNEGQAEIHMMALAECIYDAVGLSKPKVLKPGEWHIPFEDKMSDLDIDKVFKAGSGPINRQEVRVKSSVAMAARTSYTVVEEEKELLLSDFVKGFEYEIKEGFGDGTVKNQENFDKAKWVPQIYSDLDFSYIERIFKGKNKQNGLFGLRHKQKGIDLEKMIALHDRLLSQDPPHSSPLEHVARCMTQKEYTENVKGLRNEDRGYDWMRKSSLGWVNNFKGFIPYRYMVDNGNQKAED